MSLGLRCPTCQKRMSVPERSIGRRVQCPRCECVFRFTGQKEITLGRVRRLPTNGAAAWNSAEMKTPVIPSATPGMVTPVVPKNLETTPNVAAPPAAGGPEAWPAAHRNTLLDQGETVPVIDLPEVSQTFLNQLKRPVHGEPELFDDAEA